MKNLKLFCVSACCLIGIFFLTSSNTDRAMISKGDGTKLYPSRTNIDVIYNKKGYSCTFPNLLECCGVWGICPRVIIELLPVNYDPILILDGRDDHAIARISIIRVIDESYPRSLTGTNKMEWEVRMVNAPFDYENKFSISEDIQLNDEISRRLGFDGIMIKRGVYRTDYSVNKYGTVILDIETW